MSYESLLSSRPALTCYVCRSTAARSQPADAVAVRERRACWRALQLHPALQSAPPVVRALAAGRVPSTVRGRTAQRDRAPAPAPRVGGAEATGHPPQPRPARWPRRPGLPRPAPARSRWRHAGWCRGVVAAALGSRAALGGRHPAANGGCLSYCWSGHWRVTDKLTARFACLGARIRPGTRAGGAPVDPEQRRGRGQPPSQRPVSAPPPRHARERENTRAYSTREWQASQKNNGHVYIHSGLSCVAACNRQTVTTSQCTVQ